MSDLHLHHVSISVSDLERASAFYRDVLELEPLKRPPFPSAGAWFGGDTWQVHLNPNLSTPNAAGAPINPTLPHFALRHGIGFLAARMSTLPTADLLALDTDGLKSRLSKLRRYL